MPRTPDRTPGPAFEEGIYLSDHAVDPTDVGEIRRVGATIKAKDGDGVFNLRSGAGLSESAHRALRQLIHFIDDGPADGFASGAYREVLPSGSPFPTSVTWWESSAKQKKLVEKAITRSGGSATVVAPTPIVWRIYDTDGVTVLVTLQDDITYSGVTETSRTRTIT